VRVRAALAHSTEPVYRHGVSVLFVCTGNICRSPVAERLFIAHLASVGMPDVIDVRSAGTMASTGRPIHPHSAAALVALGGDPSGFSARQLTAEDVRSADIVLTMTRRHRRSVLGLDPRGLRRTFTLSEAADLARSVDREQIHSAPSTERVEVLAAHLAAARAHRHGIAADDMPDPVDKPMHVHRAVAERIASDISLLTQALVPGSDLAGVLETGT
jgi:protein-tyrosine phosphatase